MRAYFYCEMNTGLEMIRLYIFKLKNIDVGRIEPPRTAEQIELFEKALNIASAYLEI